VNSVRMSSGAGEVGEVGVELEVVLGHGEGGGELEGLGEGGLADIAVVHLVDGEDGNAGEEGNQRGDDDDFDEREGAALLVSS
jgi:hypothetical protein